MPVGSYRIHSDTDALDVQWRGPAKFRVFGGFVVAISMAEIYFAIFGHGRDRGPWADLLSSDPGSPRFGSIAFESAVLLLFVLFFLATGVRYLLPFSETLHCDCSTVTWSRIPWLSFGNRWITRSTPFAEIVGASYAVVYKSKDIHGIVLETYDNSWKMFWQIESPEANRILHGLKKLGVNVEHDSEMRASIRETMRDRRAQL